MDEIKDINSLIDSVLRGVINISNLKGLITIERKNNIGKAVNKDEDAIIVVSKEFLEKVGETDLGLLDEVIENDIVKINRELYIRLKEEGFIKEVSLDK